MPSWELPHAPPSVSHHRLPEILPTLQTGQVPPVLAHPAPACKIEPGAFCLRKGPWSRPRQQPGPRASLPSGCQGRSGSRLALCCCPTPQDTFVFPLKCDDGGLRTHTNLTSPPAVLRVVSFGALSILIVASASWSAHGSVPAIRGRGLGELSL